MTRAEMLAALTKAGITLAATALDAEVKAAFELHCMKSSSAGTASNEELIAKSVALAIKGVRAEIEADIAGRQPAAEPRVKATNNALPVVELAEDRPVTSGQEDAAKGTGLNFVRYLKAQMEAKMDGGTIISVLKGQGYEHAAKIAERHVNVSRAAFTAMKALGQSTLAGGGALVPPEFSTEFIALLRNTSVVRRSGARSVPLNGTLTMPKQTGAGSAAYAGEGAVIAASQQTVGDIVFTERKLGALTPISNDLIKNASISAEQFVLEDLKQVMALREDLAFLFGTGASDTPRGIESLMTSTQLAADTSADAESPTLAEVNAEISKIMMTLMAANIPMTTMGWLMTPRLWSVLDAVADGNGNRPFANEMEKGKLKGFPFIVTNQIPNNLGSSTHESRLILGDWAQAIIAESQMIQAEVFPNGTYETGGVAVSGISRDQSVVRLIAKHDFNLRYPGAFYSSKTDWGYA